MGRDHPGRDVDAGALQLGGEDGARQVLVEKADETPDIGLDRFRGARASQQSPCERIIEKVHARTVSVEPIDPSKFAKKLKCYDVEN
jgi:hypothetical protein